MTDPDAAVPTSSKDLLALVAQSIRRLPLNDVAHLGSAARGGAAEVGGLRADAAGAGIRRACSALLRHGLSDADWPVVAGILLAHSAQRAAPRPEVVWTGPEVAKAHRLTSAAVVELLAQARDNVLVIGYAVHDVGEVQGALSTAAAQGAALTLVLERPQDNDRYHGPAHPFAGVEARRLAWPAASRPPNASLHAKVMVADDDVLIGSANLTDSALGRNVECGLLLRSRSHAQEIRSHIDGLEHAGHLVPV